MDGHLGEVTGEPLQGVGGQVPFVGPDPIHPQLHEVGEGLAQAHRGGDVRRPRLELPRHLVPLRVAKVNGADHLAPAKEGRHRLEELPSGPENPRSGGPEGLVPAEGVKVATDGLDVHREVGGRLSAVEEDEGTGLVGPTNDLGHRVDGPQGVGDVGHGNELGVEVE